MANFVHHEPCPKCGSRDNLARYDDGSAYCFGCRYYEAPDLRHVISSLGKKGDDEQQDFEDERKAWTSDFSPECVGWLGQYEIDLPTALKTGFLWHPGREQLIFPWYDPSYRLLGYQARNFKQGSKTKYFTQGDVEKLIPVYHHSRERSKVLVLVEDVVSAVKCSRFTDSMPCLSSSLSADKLRRISKLYGTFVVWLDSNMLNNAMKMCERLEYMGAFTHLVHTPDDPKCYTYEELEKTLSRFVAE